MAEPTQMPTLNLLFMDDRSKRIHAALKNFPEFNVIIAPNVKECLRLLSGQDWDEVHLDHDLHGVEFEDPDSQECGMQVVRYLEKTGWPPNKRKPIFRVHSTNLFAAHLMITHLQKIGLTAFYEPWTYEVKEYMKYDPDGNPIFEEEK